jgi:metal-responsive CopG/Arc/MetJ family transcriptional regulator
MARKPVTISLPDDLVQETNRFCRRTSVTVSEVAREALRDYLYRKDMDHARRDFTARLRGMGIASEKGLLKKLSDKG